MAKCQDQAVTQFRIGHDGGEGVERVTDESLPFLKGLGFSYNLIGWTT